MVFVGEVVILNPLQATYQLLMPRVLTPLYAAADDGIYVINRRRLIIRYGPRTVLIYLAGAFSALIPFIGLGIALYPFT